MFKAWTLLGRVLYFFTQIGIRIVVRGSTRTRVLIVCNDQFLALKHWLGDGSWTLPGGGLHRDEEAVSGAQREVLEELGVTLQQTDLKHVGSFDASDNGFSFSCEMFQVYLLSKPKLHLQTIEILDARWFSVADLPALKSTPQLQRAVAIWQE